MSATTSPGGAEMHAELVVTSEDRPLRVVNGEIRPAIAAGKTVELLNPLSRHNLGVALTGDGLLRIQGSAGYYCGGLNNGATIEVKGNVGWAAGEAMASGHITVDGNSGMGAGASMRGGLLHIRGDAGPRCGITQKGGTIVVEGSIGFSSGFMAHKGRLICLGDAGDAIGDSLWGGEVWVAGEIGSLGIDTKIVEPAGDEVEAVQAMLTTLGLGAGQRQKKPRWKKVVSAEQLWHFESRDASSWLMI